MASPNQKFKQSLKRVSSKSKGSPGQRNKPKSSKPTSSPAQKDRDRKKNQTFRQNLLKELDAGIKKGTAGVSSSGGGSGSSAGYYETPVSAGAYDSGFPVYNIDDKFMNQIASAEATTDLIEKIQKFDKLKKVKDIYKNTDAMFDAINKNPTLTQFQKNNLRAQIQYVKENHGRLGYSLNDLMAAVGTGAYNQIVGRTPINKEQAEKLGITDQVQDIFDKYGRAAVLRPDGTVGAISPTAGQLFADIGRGAAKMFGAGPITQFLTGGKGFNIKAPEFGFGDLPPDLNLSGYFGAVPAYSGAIDMSKGIGAFMQPTGNVAGASKALQFAPMRDAREGRTPETTTQQGDGSGGGGGGTTSSTFAYVPFARPVAYNYTGGPEQMYLGGGFTQDGVPIGPFRAADGGIANFKGYGY
tara:strand:- start:7257 stop:8492 length:1236 start_codon:yes stop_codon:yes gene_type:complete